MPRKYKKRTYKKTYKKRSGYKKYKRYYKRRYYKPIKKPEIHILENSTDTSYPFNNTAYGVGVFQRLTNISSNSSADVDQLAFTMGGKPIEGRKIRLKYIYIKGFIKVASTTDADDFNCKLMFFRWKRNTSNSDINWTTLMNGSSDTPNTWTETDRLNMMYRYDWKNDIKINFYKKVKNLYRKYDDANNIIPFKMRIPLYDCVLTCDWSYNSTNATYSAQRNPSTNGLYFTFLSNKYDENTTISYKYKIYYTDY